MNLISECMKIAKRANKAAAALTARTKRMTADHSGRKRRGFFFGGAASCTLLDDTWNTGMILFLYDTILIHLHDYLTIMLFNFFIWVSAHLPRAKNEFSHNSSESGRASEGRSIGLVRDKSAPTGWIHLSSCRIGTYWMTG